MKFIKNFIEDVLIIGGLALIVAATFLLSAIAGMYCLGAACLALGIWFARHPPGRDDR